MRKMFARESGCKVEQFKRCFKKAFIVFMCCIILVCFGACKDNSFLVQHTTVYTANTNVSATQSIGKGEIYVYFTASDSLNPYLAQTKGNQQIASLMFDPLIRLDADFNAEFMIAQSINVSGKTITVNIKSVNFSDGSSLTADDVVYSLKLAKSAKYSVYKQQLSCVSGYYAENDSTIVITLNKYSPLAVNLLDFPIIKQGSTNRKTADDKDLPPIGCGRYIYNDNSGTYTLTGNKNYYGTIPQNTITLDNTPDKESLQYSIKAGEVDIYYSGLMTGDLLSMSGKINYVKQSNVVFLGLSQRGVLVNKYLRCAVSALIDRKDICKTAYFSYSEPAKSLYSTGMNIISDSADLFSETADVKTAEKYLGLAGFSSKNDSGMYVNKYGNALSLVLLYNSSNAYQKNAAQLIQKQMKSAGIDLIIDGRAYNSYKKCVADFDYDLYLGELMMNKDFDYSPLFSGDVVDGLKIATTTKAKSTSKAQKTDEYNNLYVKATDSDGDIVYGNDGEPVYVTIDKNKTTKPTTTKPTTTKNPATINEDMSKVYANYSGGKISIGKMFEKFQAEMPFVPIAFRYGVVSYNSDISSPAVSTVSDAYYNIEYLSLSK